MTIFAKTPVPSETEIQAMPTAKRVDRGIRLQRILQRAGAELDKLKVAFRSEASERRRLEPDAKGPVHFVGGIGTCKVTFKGDSLKVVEEKKFISLKDTLPPEVFYNLFDVETVATPCADFKKKLAKVAPEHFALIMTFFKEVPNAPAVEFSK